MLTINFKSSIPIYEQLVSEIMRMITVGDLKTGDSRPRIPAPASPECEDGASSVRRLMSLAPDAVSFCLIHFRGAGGSLTRRESFLLAGWLPSFGGMPWGSARSGPRPETV